MMGVSTGKSIDTGKLFQNGSTLWQVYSIVTLAFPITFVLLFSFEVIASPGKALTGEFLPQAANYGLDFCLGEVERIDGQFLGAGQGLQVNLWVSALQCG